MGLDLKLLPFDNEGEYAFSHTVLDCERQQDLFDIWLELDNEVGEKVPKYFASYVSRKGNRESHYGNTQDTPYGDKLTSVTVRELLNIPKELKAKLYRKNKAIFAYLSKLEKDRRVALFWD